ncbi:MAG: carbon storage regulator [Gemmataceae bacterium]
MLVLTRKAGESIVVPELGILLTVLEVQGNKVRLGISAPAEVAIYRREVWERVGGFRELTPCAVSADKLRKGG